MRRAVALVAALAVLLTYGSIALALGGPGTDPDRGSNLCTPPVVAWGMTLVDVYVNGKCLDEWEDAIPYLDPSANRTMVPVRYLTEHLGADVEWVGSEQKVVVKLGGKTIELWIGKKEVVVDGERKELDVPPVLRSWETNENPSRTLWRTWVPLRFVTECLGGTVDWAPPDKDHAYVRVFITWSATKQ